MDKSSLLPREQYEEVAQRYGRGPITLEIQNNHQFLFYFGANHSKDPNNRQYPALREYWNNFLNSTEGKDRIVLVELGVRKVRPDEKTAIISGAEGGIITLWAHQLNIPIVSPDFTTQEFIEQAPPNQKDLVLLTWFLSFADNWKKHAEPKPNFEQLANRWLESMMEFHGNGDVSLDRMKQLYKEVIGKDFDENDNLNIFVNPNRTGTKINEISRAQSDLRDAKIVSEIEKYWKEGKSILVVFGRGHLIIQEPALRKLLR